MAAKPRRRLTDEQRAQRRAQDRERMEQAARRLLTTEGWQQWVRVRSRNGLARYSLGNQILIAMQAPDATFVAGFHAWKDLGRRVSKGQRGIRILAPMPLRENDDEPKAGGEPEDEGRVRTLFKSVAVFDVAQTEALPGREPLPVEPPSQPITGDSHAHLLVSLEAFAGELGYSVRRAELDAATGGWCDRKKLEIVVNERRPPNGQVRVLVHELAHALGIGYADRGRERAEVMVDCVTFIVCGQVGLDTSGETIPYVAGWGEDGALDAIPAGRANDRRGRTPARSGAAGRPSAVGGVVARRGSLRWFGCGQVRPFSASHKWRRFRKRLHGPTGPQFLRGGQSRPVWGRTAPEPQGAPQ